MMRYGFLLVVAFLFLISPSYEQSFNHGECEQSLFMAFSSYCDINAIRGGTCSWCKRAQPMKMIEAFNVNSIQGFVALKGSTFHVVFRGSSNIQNWLNNLKFFKKDYKGVRGAQIHIGFSNSFDDVKGVFYSALKKARSICPGCRDITVSGHSLGGALSVLAGVEIRENSAFSGFRVKVITFGSPRVGNDVFIKHFRNLISYNIRMVHNKDNVAHVPPKMLGYQHPPREIWHVNGQYRQCNPNDGEDGGCSNSAIGIGFFDHNDYMGHKRNSGC